MALVSMGPHTSSSGFVINYDSRYYMFHLLMERRIQTILMVSSLYDKFIIEQDGQLSERILEEYFNLNLTTSPSIVGASSASKALEMLADRMFDLVITTKYIGPMDPLAFSERVKELSPATPVILLILNASEIRQLPPPPLRKAIHKTFVWLGDSRIFLAIIKLLEDELNLERDVERGKVQIILFINNSLRRTSLLLPLTYAEVIKQTQNLIDKSREDTSRLLRMRARPKIMWARNFKEAQQIFEKYKAAIQGVISNVQSWESNEDLAEQEISFISQVKSYNPFLPQLYLRPTVRSPQELVWLYQEALENFCVKDLGFGDFVFRLPGETGKKLSRVANVDEFVEVLPDIPEESLVFHIRHKHFYNWLVVRGEFEMAEHVESLRNTPDLSDVAKTILVTQDRIRQKYEGSVPKFSRTFFRQPMAFGKIGQGSLGGKGRGLAFIYELLGNSDINAKVEDAFVTVPKSLVVCTDEFDKFVLENQIYDHVGKSSDEELVQLFAQSRTPTSLVETLSKFLEVIETPLAVRSSSLLEDSHALPFAGLYNTYFLPNNHPSQATRLKQLCLAIRLVYASMFVSLPKSFAERAGQKIESEKMAVVIQEVVGSRYENRYYPDISGVLHSFNFYPVGHMEPEDGVAQIALGLGKAVVEGKQSLRFCPAFPQVLPQFYSSESTFENSQKEFYALDLSRTEGFDLTKGEDDTLVTCDLACAEKDGILFKVGSTYDPHSDSIRDGLSYPGPRVLTFAGVLKFNVFPLTQILIELQHLGEEAFGCPVEIEFAVSLSKSKHRPPTFYVLQIRPLVTNLSMTEVEVQAPQLGERTNHLFYSTQALGNGHFQVTDLVYVRDDVFDRLRTQEIAKEVRILNDSIKNEGRQYLLVGPGRWGTAETSLGIPVQWDDVSASMGFVEMGLEGYDIDPSHGTHFFMNIVGLNIPYITVPHAQQQSFIQKEVLRTQPAYQETTHLRHLRFEKSRQLFVDGRSRKALLS